MGDLDRKVDGKRLLREQSYICWMTAIDAAPPSGRTAAEIRNEHFAYLLELERRGVLFAAGPFVDENGERHGAGMLILRAKSRAEAEGPFMLRGPASPAAFRMTAKVKLCP